MAVKLLLFDFDGTLADSFDAAIAAANRLAPEFGYETLTDETAQALKSQGARQILRASGIPLRRLPSWIRRMKREMRREIHLMASPIGMDEALAQLRAAGVSLGVVTSNSRENLDLFLQAHRWTTQFSGLACGSNLFGKSRLIKRLMSEGGLPGADVAYVGDEERDVEAARRAGVVSVAVTWGFNSREVLARARPDHLFDEPRQLLDLL